MSTKILVSAIRDIEEHDRQALVATLDRLALGASTVAIVAHTLMTSRPLTAFRMFAWIGRQDAPSGDLEREEWLRAHNNACYLAITHGETDERRDVASRAVDVAPANIAIYHNVASLFCALGEPDAALQAIREGVARGYDDAIVASIGADTDLDAIRHTEAFAAIVEGRSAPELPAWAHGWTITEFIQFRELIRTVLNDADLTNFERGTIDAGNATYNLLPLVERCRERPMLEWTLIVHRHFHQLLR